MALSLRPDQSPSVVAGLKWPGVADGSGGQLAANGTVPARLDDRKLGLRPRPARGCGLSHLDLRACEVRPGVRRAGLPRQSPPLTPGQRRRRRRLDQIRLNSATQRMVRMVRPPRPARHGLPDTTAIQERPDLAPARNAVQISHLGKTQLPAGLPGRLAGRRGQSRRSPRRRTARPAGSGHRRRIRADRNTD